MLFIRAGTLLFGKIYNWLQIWTDFLAITVSKYNAWNTQLRLKTTSWNPNRQSKQLSETVKWSSSQKDSSIIFPWSLEPDVIAPSLTWRRVFVWLQAVWGAAREVFDQDRKHEKGVQRVQGACFSSTQQLHFRAKLLLWAQHQRAAGAKMRPKRPWFANPGATHRTRGQARSWFLESASNPSLSLYSESRPHILHLRRLLTDLGKTPALRIEWWISRLANFLSPYYSARYDSEYWKVTLISLIRHPRLD